MKKFGFATIVASGLAAAVLGLAGPAQSDIGHAPLLLAGAAAAAITAAPNASAASVRTCSDGGGATICQRPGNVEIHAEPPRVSAPRVYGPFSSPFPFLFD